MMSGPAQLPLGVGLRDDATFANFMAGGNQTLVDQLVRQPTPTGEQFLYLWGAPESGKSHLLQAACHEASQQGISTLYLPLSDIGHFPPLMLEDIEHLELIAIDDLDTVIGRKRWEEGLFHCFNRLRDAGRRLIIAAEKPPRQLPVKLADLGSRLSWGTTFHLKPLNDDERLEALKLRARSRGMMLPDEVGRYLCHRGPRQLTTLFDTLARLDEASLSAQRKLTIPFVKQALGW
ncbi:MULTISPECIES: DnaA regulatory inactivator Hda [Larsenimonas]|uniref:DnaA regulatory inactivator Hda n=1 Tax=Larsenimonas suaedae TaxID=1851019 RepID=A0ABU1GYB4_9GAMM|nr:MULTISPECIES: DnaA regulatory inactivator Hda [Larsenimonas]MCM2971589.1 DnaA regulatory inactivator Hda [Larsenimonas suaedae]MCM5703696.1 DnaA regulatory inactivator Hda [Larsenimonas salina]MDR5896845.1 DnaA regulatory inactivator Hda [Larsenimonas suaedae]